MFAVLTALILSSLLTPAGEPLPGQQREPLLQFWQARGKEARIQQDPGSYGKVRVETGQEANRVQRTYLFDEKGRCTEMEIASSCVRCLEDLLRDILQHPETGWQKLNENQYISRFESRLLLEIPPGTSLKNFVILYADWTTEAYELIRKKQ